MMIEGIGTLAQPEKKTHDANDAGDARQWHGVGCEQHKGTKDAGDMGQWHHTVLGMCFWPR